MSTPPVVPSADLYIDSTNAAADEDTCCAEENCDVVVKQSALRRVATKNGNKLCWVCQSCFVRLSKRIGSVTRKYTMYSDASMIATLIA